MNRAGDTITLTVQWVAYAGGPATPMTGVQVKVTNLATAAVILGPTAVGVTTPATGVNAYSWASSAALPAAAYLITWTGTDPQSDVVTATEVIDLAAAASGWAPDYLTTVQGANFLRIDDNLDDVELAMWITAASRAIDKRCNRQFGQVAAVEARTYRRTPFYDPTSGLWLLEIDDLQDTAGLLVNGVAYASSGATLLPDNAAVRGVPYERIGMTTWPVPSYPGMPQSNVLTGRWGWNAVPAQVPAAAKLQLSRWNSRRDSPFGVAGSPDQGAQLRLLARLDPDVATTLAGLSRRRRAG